MRTLYAFVAAATLLSASPALAAGEAAIDLNELTCAQFTGYSIGNRGLILMWFEGYYTEENEPATIDFGKMASHLTRLLIACEANPESKVLDLADDAMED
ncbi:MAG: HdeA/HdeB family chaperone [Methyloceanibacter sp.]